MKRELLESFYEYGVHTNQRLLAQAEKLDETTLRRAIPGVGRSVYQTFLHMLNAERGWLSGLKGEERAPRYTEQDLPDLATIGEALARVADDRRAFLAGASDEWLHQPMFSGASGQPVFFWQVVLHVANHGTQHRAEIAAALTEAGFSPGDVDMIYYYET